MKRLNNRNLRARVRRSKTGQGMVEYAVLLALVSLAVIGGIVAATNSVDSAFDKTTNNVANGGTDFTPGAPSTLPPSGPIPTLAPPPTNTPKPTPTNTPLPTSTPKPTNTAGPTNTPAPTNTAVPTNTPKPTSTPNATKTASVYETVSAQASGGAIRYRVDPNGWPNGNGFCGQGDSSQSGNQGLINVNLYGDAGDVVCVRIDTFIAGMQNPTETHGFDITNQSGNGSPTNTQLTPQKKAYGGAVTVESNILFTKQSNGGSDIIAHYIMIKLPSDICTNNNTQTLRFKATDDSNSHGVKISTNCQARPTPTPKPATSTPGPTNTPGPTSTATQIPTPTIPPTPISGGS